MGEKVKIDGRGQETMLKKKSSIGNIYEVMLDGNEFIITARANCLTQFETESESRSISMLTKSTTEKEVQSDDIPNFVNQQKNTQTLLANILNLKLLTSLKQQEAINEHMQIY